jgi:hypothetical protein
MSDALQRLRALLDAEGGLIADLLDRSVDGSDGSGNGVVGAGGSISSASSAPGFNAGGGVGVAQLAAAGPRAEGRREQYELLIETVYEGYLLHYHSPRVVRPAEDDLGLLVGDRLYALGLARLVRLGDIEAVAELADVITLSALAHAAGAPELADAVWQAGARAVGWGASPRHDHAKALTRAGSPDALDAMRSLAAG